MDPLHLAQTFAFTGAAPTLRAYEQNGADVAHDTLARAALRLDAIAGLHFFVDPVSRGRRPHHESALARVRAQCPGKDIATWSPGDLPRLAATHRYVVLHSAANFSTIAQVRDAGPRLFPICGILHSIDSPQMLMQSCASLLTAEPCDAIVSSSEAGRQTVERLLDTARGWLERKLQTTIARRPRVVKIPLPVDPDSFGQTDRLFARQTLSLPADALVLLSVGRITADMKADLDVLLLAFRHLGAAHPQALLVIAGQDHDERQARALQDTAETLGIGDRVRLMPNVPSFAKPLLYASADIFVSPVDNLQETFGIALLEAMASRLPIVASDWSGYRDIVEHGETGWLVPTYWPADCPADWSQGAPIDQSDGIRAAFARRTIVDPAALVRALDQLLADPLLRRRFGDAGRARVLAHFTTGAILPRHLALWQELSEVADGMSASHTPWWLDYGDVFAHFASATWNAETHVRPGDLQASPSDRRGLRGGDASDWPVAWLLKKGLLQLAPTQEEVSV